MSKISQQIKVQKYTNIYSTFFKVTIDIKILNILKVKKFNYVILILFSINFSSKFNNNILYYFPKAKLLNLCKKE